MQYSSTIIQDDHTTRTYHTKQTTTCITKQHNTYGSINQDTTRQRKTIRLQNKTIRDNARRDDARQDHKRQDNTIQDNSRQDTSIQYGTTQHKPRQYKNTPDKTRQANIRQCNARANLYQHKHMRTQYCTMQDGTIQYHARQKTTTTWQSYLRHDQQYTTTNEDMYKTRRDKTRQYQHTQYHTKPHTNKTMQANTRQCKTTAIIQAIAQFRQVKTAQYNTRQYQDKGITPQHKAIQDKQRQNKTRQTKHNTHSTRQNKQRQYTTREDTPRTIQSILQDKSRQRKPRQNKAIQDNTSKAAQ